MAAGDIQTAGFEVDSTYSEKNPGYQATQTLAVTLRNLGGRAGKTIADAANAGVRPRLRRQLLRRLRRGGHYRGCGLTRPARRG